MEVSFPCVLDHHGDSIWKVGEVNLTHKTCVISVVFCWLSGELNDERRHIPMSYLT